jgi:hypothetical protein
MGHRNYTVRLLEPFGWRGTRARDAPLLKPLTERNCVVKVLVLRRQRR